MMDIWNNDLCSVFSFDRALTLRRSALRVKYLNYLHELCVSPSPLTGQSIKLLLHQKWTTPESRPTVLWWSRSGCLACTGLQLTAFTLGQTICTNWTNGVHIQQLLSIIITLSKPNRLSVKEPLKMYLSQPCSSQGNPCDRSRNSVSCSDNQRKLWILSRLFVSCLVFAMNFCK